MDVVLPYAQSTAVGAFVRETFANLVIGISGQFTFAMIGKISDSGESLEADAFLIPRRNNSSEIKKIRRTICDAQDFEEIDSNGSKIRESCEQLCAAQAKITLSRNGKAVIDTGTSPDVHSDDVLMDGLIANQFFFFFKDIAHRHQHHDPRQDSITQASHVTSENDEAWIADTQHSLYREIIRFKRFRREAATYNASGLLTYAQAFEKSHVQGARVGREFHHSDLEKSLEVSRQEMLFKSQKRIATIETIRNWFFALFGFVISATFLSRAATPLPEISVDPSINEFTQFVASRPIPVLGLVLVISVVASYLTHSREPAAIELARSILRWMQGRAMRYYFLANVVMAVLFATLFYFFLLAALL